MNKRIAALALLFIAFSSAMAADIFDIPATGAWVKVRNDKEIKQWSARPASQPRKQIDFISQLVEGGKRDAFYVVRDPCSNGSVSIVIIKVGAKDGVGIGCNGGMVSKSITILDKVQSLPAEAASLLKTEK